MTCMMGIHLRGRQRCRVFSPAGGSSLSTATSPIPLDIECIIWTDSFFQYACPG